LLEGRSAVGFELNPNPGSQWAKLARACQKMVPFHDAATGRYIASVVEGVVQLN
jgi:hypothetical protein